MGGGVQFGTSLPRGRPLNDSCRMDGFPFHYLKKSLEKSRREIQAQTHPLCRHGDFFLAIGHTAI
jgi:hypothetical protein